MVAYKAAVIKREQPRFEHILLALIACDIGLYIPVFPTVLHSVVAHESMQIILLYSISSTNKQSWALMLNTACKLLSGHRNSIQDVAELRETSPRILLHDDILHTRHISPTSNPARYLLRS